MADQGSFKLDPNHLATVISAQETAYQKISSAASGVQSDADTVRSAIRSQSGQNLQNGFLDWAQNFRNIVHALDELKEKVTGVRRTGESADHEATSTGRVVKGETLPSLQRGYAIQAPLAPLQPTESHLVRAYTVEAPMAPLRPVESYRAERVVERPDSYEI